MSDAIHIRAYAKLNLVLSVGPPIAEGLPDAGFHPIASWFVPIDLADEITYEPRESGGIELCRDWADDAPRRSPMGWLTENDLAVRAVHRLAAAVGRELSGRIDLRKRIPIGGGLGGGSSDAASTLRAANDAHALGLSLSDLAEIGQGLGADVPYFIDEHCPPRPALVGGLGERIERIETAKTSLLLALPGFGCDTGRVYQRFDDTPIMLDEPGVARLASQGLIDPESLFNDLFGPAKHVEPELGRLEHAIRRTSKRPVHLSGSGSTMFLVPEDYEHAERLADLLTLHIPGVAFVPTMTINPLDEAAE